jgi:F-type H+-transporting ATPase subunit alpha
MDQQFNTLENLRNLTGLGDYDLQPLETVLKTYISDYIVPDAPDTASASKGYGTIVSVADNVAMVSGIPLASLGEIINFGEYGEISGIVMSLDSDLAGVALLQSPMSFPKTVITEGCTVETTTELVSLQVSTEAFGRLTDPFGRPVDGLGELENASRIPVEAAALTVLERRPVSEPLHTGFISFDTLIPLGLGQREAVLGDRSSGKTEAILTITNTQALTNSGIKTVYVAVGQKASSIATTVSSLKERGIYQNTAAVAAAASDPSSIRFLAPQASVALAEWLARKNGYNILIAYDDLSRHAAAYAELSLLLRRPPGREGYPADLFYRHAWLLERAGAFKGFKGSVTALPVVELDNGDLSAYLPTNIVSITDGQAVLLSELFNAGVKPALDISLSVSRLGSSVQPPAMRAVSSKLKIQLTEIRSVQRLAGLSSDLDPEAARLIRRGEILSEILKQDKNESFLPEETIYALYISCYGLLDALPKEMDVRTILKDLLSKVSLQIITDVLKEGRKISPPEEQRILDATAESLTAAGLPLDSRIDRIC